MKTTAKGIVLRDPAGLAVAIRAQTRLMFKDWKWLYLTGGLVFFLILVSSDFGADPGPLPGLFLVGIVGSLLSCLWAVAVWDKEGEQRTYHWSLPASRPVNDLAKVVAGGIFLVTAFVVLVLAGFGIGAVTGELPALLEMEARSYLNLLTAPLVVYLLATPLVLWRHALAGRWWIFALFVLAILSLWLPVVERAFQRIFDPSPLSLSTALFGAFLDDAIPPGGGPEAWVPSVALWLGAGVALTAFTALVRPADLKRSIGRFRA